MNIEEETEKIYYFFFGVGGRVKGNAHQASTRTCLLTVNRVVVPVVVMALLMEGTETELEAFRSWRPSASSRSR